MTWQFLPNARRPNDTSLTWFQSWLLSRGGSRFESVKREPLLYPGRELRDVVAVAARRSGKTVGSRLVALTACMDDGPGDVGYMAPTLGQAKRIFWRPLMQDLRNPEARAFLASKPNNSELSIEFKSGTRLYLYSAEAFERVRGDGFKLFLCDETADPRFTDEVFSEVIRPALSDNLGTLVQVGTPKGRGRFYKEFKKGQIGDSTYDPRYESIQVTAIEAKLIAPPEIRRARDTLPTRAFRQEYEATFNASIGLVYDEWDESKHVVTAAQLPFAFDEVIVGVDWGVAKRGAMVVIGIDRVVVPGGDDYDAEEMPRVWILEDNSERLRPYSYSTDRENPGWWTVAQRIQREWSPRRWYCDPAGGEREANEAQAAGYLTQLQEAVSGVDPSARVVAADNKVSPGISAVQTFMHHDAFLKEEPRFRVLNTCKTLIRELENYRWATAAGATENDDDGFEDRPVKKEDHCFVAGTMVTTLRGDVPIEQIVAGDTVLTRSGFYPVKAAGMTSADSVVFELRYVGGSVRGTGNHRVWAEGGWRRIDTLTYGSILVASSKVDVRVMDVSVLDGRQPVYDLTVDGPPEFYANGILVHNCSDATRYAVFSHFFSKRRGGRNDVGHEDRGG